MELAGPVNADCNCRCAPDAVSSHPEVAIGGRFRHFLPEITQFKHIGARRRWLGVDSINQLIFFGGALAIVSILATRLSARLGAPLLLIFLILGMLAGEDGIGGLHFSNYSLTFGVGSTALAIIAVARKLLTILNAIIRDQKPWQPT